MFVGIVFIGGLLVWLFGCSNIYVGLSGVIYGLWGYLICYGIMYCLFKVILISIVVVVLYSGLIWGVFL